MPVALPLQKWPFSRDVNMREELITNFLRSGGVVTGRGNPAAMPSTLMDFGFWDMPQSKPTPIGQALLDGKIFWSECVLWLLSKRPSSREENNIKPLVVVCKFLSKCRELGLPPELWKVDISPLSTVESYDDITEAFIHDVIANRSGSSSLHGYADIWINAFEQTALFKFRGKSSDKHLEVVDVNADSWKVVKYLALLGPEMSQTPPKSNSSIGKKLFYEYMGSTGTGIVEIIAPPFMRNLIPNLSNRYAHLSFAEGKTLKEKFSLWLIATGRSRASTSYPPSLEAMSAPQVKPPQPKHTTYSWPGMIEFLTGVPPMKPVFEIDNAKDFLEIYQPLKLLAESLNRNTNPGFANQLAFEECWDYTRSSVGWGDSTTLMSAFKAYCEFLKWLESISPSQEKKPKELSPANVDRLSVALKMFAEKRKEEEWCSDKTDGNANKPRAGYVANKQLRVLSNTPADIGKLNGDGASNIKAWFKNYWNVADGKSWLEGLSDADLSGFGPYIAHLLQPGSPAVAKPAKFSNALEAAVKAVIKPEETGLYDERVNETLKFLGLIGFDWNENFDADDLGEAVNAQRVIKRRLKDMGLKRIQESTTADDGNAPDYLTVNEFLWFVKLNLNRIEKEVQEGKMKPAIRKGLDSKQKDKKPKVDINDSEDVLLLRLRAALRTKPFAILAGHSGTGKSRMVRKLAYMTCNDNALRYVLDDAGNIKDGADGKPIPLKEPGNFCMVQVKPNWHDSSDLLGYYSELGKRYRSTDFVEFICKAYAYPTTPFFVCLDEMNLAPVEQYFAEYLSAIESRKLTSGGVLTTDELIAKSVYTKEDATGNSVMYEWLGCTMTESQQWLETYGLTIPRNLFVVGTVNMDETTNQFSRKVLDRAMTIEMTDADFDSFGAKPSELKFDDEYMGDDAVKEMLSGGVQADTLTAEQKNNLNALKAVLAPTSFAVAYRFANEYALYEESLKKTVDSSVKPNPPGTPEGTPEEVLTLSEPAAAAVPAAASPEAAESASAGEAAPAVEEGTAEGAAPAPAKKDPAIPSAFDDMVLMKVLPRISGDEADVKQIFYEGRVVGKKGTRENPADKTLMKILDVKKDTESLRKIAAILDRGGTYLSFWP